MPTVVKSFAPVGWHMRRAAHADRLWLWRRRANVLRFTNLDIALPFLQAHELQDVRGFLGAPRGDETSGL
jgi:hypothetical protein